MTFPAASRKAAFISAPRALQATGPQGQVLAVSVSAVASYFALSAGLSQAPFDSTTRSDLKSLTRNYLTIECDVDLGIILGSTAALVTAGNAPVIATVGTLAAGVYTAAAGTCFVIYAKQPTRILLQDGLDLFFGFVASGAGTMRVYQSSSDSA
jgi:hypothetical protein